MDDRLRFRRNDLMGLKPALHFDVTMTPQYDKRRVSFANGLGDYPEQKKFDRSKTFLDSKTILPPARSKEHSFVEPQNRNYIPPVGYKPQFTVPSTKPQTEVTGKLTEASFRSLNRTNHNLRSAGNILNQNPTQNYSKWDEVDSNLDHYNGKPSLNSEMDRLRGKLNTVNRYEDMMRDMRKIADKKFVVEMDTAIGNVLTHQIPTEKEIKKAFDKHAPNYKHHEPSFSDMRVVRPPIVIKKKRRLRTQESSTDEEMSEGQIREIAEKRANEILKKQYPKRSEPTGLANPLHSQLEGPNQKVIKLPNGLAMIKNKDPNIQPTIIMPPEKDTERETTDEGSDTDDIMNEYMDNLMQLKMMQAMQQKPKKRNPNGDSLDYFQDEMESKKSFKKKKKKKKKRFKAPKSIPLDRNPSVSRISELPPVPQKEPSVEVEPLEPEPEPPKLDLLPSALSKLWQIKTAFLYMKLRLNFKRSKNTQDYNENKAYFDSDIPGIQEQTFYMLKSRLGLIIEDIIKDKSLNFDISQKNPQNYSQLKDALTYILDEIVHLSGLREDENFDNPLVLSFMSRFALPNCFVPDKFLFKYEIDRIKFATTGKTHFDLQPKVSKMLIGSYILIKIFVDKLLLNAQEFFKSPGLNFDQGSYDNLRVLSGCIYHIFKDIFSILQPIKNNTEVIELVPKPVLRFKPMFFNNDARSQTDEILSGVPPQSNYAMFFSDSVTYGQLKRKMIKIMNNFYSQALFQKDTENMKQYEMRIENRKNVGKKLKRVMPELTSTYEKYVTETKKKLFLID